MSEPASDFPDPGCLARLRAGHADAFEAVVRHFERPLRAWLATRTPPGVDGDEIAQKSFIAAYTRIGEFEDGSNFAAWLFTIARWQLQTEVTKLRRVADYHTRYAPDLLQLELQRQWETPPDLLTTRLDHLRQCMQQLGESLSQFLHWRYYDEIPLEEMARLSGRSVAAVKKQLWQLRQRLQACINARMASEGERQPS